MQKEIIGFADDTTGALDVAGSFHSRGLQTAVQLEPYRAQLVSTPCLIKNLNSRYDTSQNSSRNLMQSLVEASSETGQQSLFLKVDSTLRGNIISDSLALADFDQSRPVFIAPAFPFYGRTCVDGTYLVKGQPIKETEFAKDRAFNFSSSQLHDNNPAIHHIDWRILHRGISAIINTVSRSGRSVFTFDARDQTDLELIASAGLNMSAALVGSSGLGRAFPKQSREYSSEFSVDSTIPTLFVIGSIHQTARVQKEELAFAGISGTELLRRHIGDLQSLQAIREKTQEQLAQGKTVYLSTPDEVTTDKVLWNDIESSIGEVSHIRAVPHNLVIVGGETARATLASRDITTLYIQSEYEAGVPISTTPESSNAILTKAGGFGHSNTLVDIYNYIY